jgi:hypothetical protein
LRERTQSAVTLTYRDQCIPKRSRRRHRISTVSGSPRDRPKRSSTSDIFDSGTTGGINRPLRRCQISLEGNCSRKYASHRLMVKRGTPSNSWSLRIQKPSRRCWKRAVTTTMHAPQYTRRSQNKTDGGRVRHRQPSRPQQRLKRTQYSSGKQDGPPRGLLGLNWQGRYRWCEGEKTGFCVEGFLITWLPACSWVGSPCFPPRKVRGLPFFSFGYLVYFKSYFHYFFCSGSRSPSISSTLRWAASETLRPQE